MKDETVITRNLAQGARVVDSLIKKPSRLSRMGLIYGLWGYGKTFFIQWIYSNVVCFYCCAKTVWARSTVMMVEDFLSAFRVEPSGRLRQDFRELIRAAKKNHAPLILDEADRIVRKTELVELVRDIHDFAQIPVILVGQENIINLLHRRNMGSVFSRITEIYEFQPLDITDVQQVAKQLCELECHIETASFIRTVCLGDFRLLNTLLEKAENLCHLNNKAEITMAIAKEAASTLPERGRIDLTGKDQTETSGKLKVA